MVNTNVRAGVLLDNLERPVLHILFDFWVVNLASDKTLGVEDSVFWVGGESVLCGISDSAK